MVVSPGSIDSARPLIVEPGEAASMTLIWFHISRGGSGRSERHSLFRWNC
jgi:hypothetical protein